MVDSGKGVSGRVRRPVSGATKATKGATAKVTKSTSGRAPAKSSAAARKAENKSGNKPESAEKVSTGDPAAKNPTVDITQAAVAPGTLKVRPDESPWTDEEVREVRDELDADVNRLRRDIATAETELADLLRDSGDGAGDDQADAGTKAFEREHEMSLANNSRDLLVQSERALGRIDDGTYGICESCGEPIGKARLQAFPRATLCVTCKQREERR